jgi:hypothetical protein
MRSFTRHYAEMVVAMFAGMIVLGLPAEAGLRVIGSSSADLQVDAPAVLLIGMALTMTVPMVAWMRFRGHGWRPCAEMAGAMFVPTLIAVALLGSADFHALMMWEHVGMLIAMLGAMLARPAEYMHAHHA